MYQKIIYSSGDVNRRVFSTISDVLEHIEPLTIFGTQSVRLQNQPVPLKCKSADWA